MQYIYSALSKNKQNKQKDIAFFQILKRKGPYIDKSLTKIEDDIFLKRLHSQKQMDNNNKIDPIFKNISFVKQLRQTLMLYQVLINQIKNDFMLTQLDSLGDSIHRMFTQLLSIIHFLVKIFLKKQKTNTQSQNIPNQNSNILNQNNNIQDELGTINFHKFKQHQQIELKELKQKQKLQRQMYNQHMEYVEKLKYIFHELLRMQTKNDQLNKTINNLWEDILKQTRNNTKKCLLIKSNSQVEKVINDSCEYFYQNHIQLNNTIKDSKLDLLKIQRGLFPQFEQTQQNLLIQINENKINQVRKVGEELLNFTRNKMILNLAQKSTQTFNQSQNKINTLNNFSNRSYPNIELLQYSNQIKKLEEKIVSCELKQLQYLKTISDLKDKKLIKIQFKRLYSIDCYKEFHFIYSTFKKCEHCGNLRYLPNDKDQINSNKKYTRFKKNNNNPKTLHKNIDKSNQFQQLSNPSFQVKKTSNTQQNFNDQQINDGQNQNQYWSKKIKEKKFTRLMRSNHRSIKSRQNINSIYSINQKSQGFQSSSQQMKSYTEQNKFVHDEIYNQCQSEQEQQEQQQQFQSLKIINTFSIIIKPQSISKNKNDINHDKILANQKNNIMTKTSKIKQKKRQSLYSTYNYNHFQPLQPLNQIDKLGQLTSYLQNGQKRKNISNFKAKQHQTKNHNHKNNEQKKINSTMDIPRFSDHMNQSKSKFENKMIKNILQLQDRCTILNNLYPSQITSTNQFFIKQHLLTQNERAINKSLKSSVQQDEQKNISKLKSESTLNYPNNKHNQQKSKINKKSSNKRDQIFRISVKFQQDKQNNVDNYSDFTFK